MKVKKEIKEIKFSEEVVKTLIRLYKNKNYIVCGIYSKFFHFSELRNL